MLTVVDKTDPAGAKPKFSNIRNCERCNVPYDWRRSTSFTLKMRYCSTLCELASEGFLLERYLKDDVHRLLEGIVPEEVFQDEKLKQGKG